MPSIEPVVLGMASLCSFSYTDHRLPPPESSGGFAFEVRHAPLCVDYTGTVNAGLDNAGNTGHQWSSRRKP
jgi:hypothetical protein